MFSSPLSKKTITILHVDDEQEFLDITQAFLGNITPEFHFITTTSPNNVFELLNNHAIDVIISDYQMREMNGLDLLVNLRSQGVAIPFIILTGRGREEVVINALNAGADYYLQKGGDVNVLFTELQHMIRQCVQKRRTEETLHTFHQTIVQSSLMVMITDENGVIEYVNPAFSRVTGFTTEEVIGKTTRILKSGLMSEADYTRFWQTITSGKEFRGEFCYRKKSDELYCVMETVSPITNSRGKITHFLTLQEDITRQKLVTARFSEYREYYRILLQNTDNLVIGLDTDYNITFFNPKSEEIFGRRRQEVLGKKFPEIFLSSPELEKVQNEIKEVFAGGRISNLRTVFKRHNGKELHVNWKLFPIMGISNQIKSLLCIGQVFIQQTQEDLSKLESHVLR